MQLMHAEIQLPTPLVPVREYRFIRFCKQHAEGNKWAVVDVPIDFYRDGPNGNPNLSCKRLPSGCILEDMPYGCQITWVDHSQYDESAVHQIYRPLVNSGIAFGAHRWVATLKRHCESLAIPMFTVPSDYPAAISPSGKSGFLMLAQRMSDSFMSGICPSSACKWDILHISNMANNDRRIMSRLIQDASGENRAIVLSASTSVWMPVSRQKMFYFLRDARMRGRWDGLSNSESMEEIVRIPKGQFGDSVSIIGAAAGKGNKSNFLYLQDSWIDSSGAMVIYSPISMQSYNMVMSNGEDASFIPVLPSGFSILPDGNSSNKTMVRSDGSGSSGSGGNIGCLLTVGLQMLLISSRQSSKLTNESIVTVNEIISCTIQKIKNALGVA
ncbi:unnamed protein product [Trifolium pratense]|uniref:Uncharacterized protein n=1 Tax=Trifolium pratense TaxID=57577 RepID=A0ACB0LB59_TRIPR|nr:unnamed protein product [Trifolium pratense]